MTRKAAMKQLFNFVQDEYNIKSSNHIQGTLLDMFGSFIEEGTWSRIKSTLRL